MAKGYYRCCGETALKFAPFLTAQGCRVFNHTPSGTTDPAILAVLQRQSELILWSKRSVSDPAPTGTAIHAAQSEELIASDSSTTRRGDEVFGTWHARHEMLATHDAAASRPSTRPHSGASSRSSATQGARPQGSAPGAYALRPASALQRACGDSGGAKKQYWGLHEFNVLDYFAMSQFYDNSCLNEQVKMQARFNALEAAQLDRRQMKGIEYDLAYFSRQPSLFVIVKQNRMSPTKTELIAVYYIVEGTIYQSPNLLHLLANRVRTSLYFSQQALKKASEAYRYHPILGYRWSTDPDLFEHLHRSNEERKRLNAHHEESSVAPQTDDQSGSNKQTQNHVEQTSAAAVTSLDEQRRAFHFSQRLDDLIAATFQAEPQQSAQTGLSDITAAHAGSTIPGTGVRYQALVAESTRDDMSVAGSTADARSGSILARTSSQASTDAGAKVISKIKSFLFLWMRLHGLTVHF
nr:Mediator of RNA polymerase II transcription subunit 6 [Polyrhizophydium stewartii]